MSNTAETRRIESGLVEGFRAENEALRARVSELEDHMVLAANELEVCSSDALLCAAIRSVATTSAALAPTDAKEQPHE